jgi:DNA-binding NarL/FixJ family response regulator
MSDHIRLAIIDDDPLLLLGTRLALQPIKGMEIVAEGKTAVDAIRIAKEKKPDIMVLDIAIQGGGIEAQRIIFRDCPGLKTIMLTASRSKEHVIAALEAGARAYVLKEIAGQEFQQVVQAVREGATYVTPSLAAPLLRGLQHRSIEDGVDTLTHRERQILDHVCRGLTNKEVARVLGLSDKTVKHYMTNILDKLHVRNRVEAVLREREKSG